MSTQDTLLQLSIANRKRQAEWDSSDLLDAAYRSNELAGETGEVCNVVKKLERERLGIRGSRDTVAHLASELADVVICVGLIANHYGIDLSREVPAKFDETSINVGLDTRFWAV